MPTVTRPFFPTEWIRHVLAINDLGRHYATTRKDVEAAISKVLASGWFVLGPHVRDFEQAFARYCGVSECVGVANGTDAIELALRGLGLAPGDKVVVAANAGMYATVAMMTLGCRPVFVDVHAGSMLMDATALRAVDDPGVRAVIVTHLYGRLADMEEITTICAQRGWPLIEDCAQAHGASRDGRRAGSFGHAATFSFYPTKNLGALGDGGAITTQSTEFAQKLRQLSQYGWGRKYEVAQSGGRNSRLDEIQAAILLAKLPRLDGWNTRRREIAAQYTRGISHADVRLPAYTDESWVAHLYVIECTDRDHLRKHLAANQVASDIHYPIPDHRQAALAEDFHGLSLPVTEQLATRILSLPCFPEMTDAEVEHVIQAVNQWQSK